MKNELKNKVATAALALGLFAGTGGVAFAAGDSSAFPEKGPFEREFAITG